jgi:hypothetical protein
MFGPVILPEQMDQTRRAASDPKSQTVVLPNSKRSQWNGITVPSTLQISV